MNRDRFAGGWMQISGKLTEQWGKLIHDQLTVAAGIGKQLAGRMREHRGIAQQQADWQLDDFMIRHHNWWDTSQQQGPRPAEEQGCKI